MDQIPKTIREAKNALESAKRAARYYARWAPISAVIGVLSGLASAIFLIVLEKTTETREANQWLLSLLPLGGLSVGLFYHLWGKDVEGGNNLIIDEFHDPKKVIPFRMAPLVLLGTILTHLFGGSAGREGTAVQMGGSIADQFTHGFKVSRAQRRTLLMAGMAGGFGSVFGVPFAGTVFGLEVLAIGKLHLSAIVECAIAAFVAHHVALSCGVHHTAYLHPSVSGLTAMDGIWAALAGIACGGAARLFSFLSEGIKRRAKKLIPNLPLRAAIGGAVISGLYLSFPLLIRYSGLGVPLIVTSLSHHVPVYDWFGKLGMTALTLGVGFKGGEVTPLLFVGSTLGNALSYLLPMSLPVLASVCFVGVFAGAANTPFACTLMAMELFGHEIGLFAAFACFGSYLVSGHRGIYHSQKVHIPKSRYASRTVEFVQLLFQRPAIPECNEESERKKESDK